MPDQTAIQRVRINLHGLLQGVGFRPFVYQLADEIGLKGWVNNSSQGVLIEAEGDSNQLQGFIIRLQKECPPHAYIQGLESLFLDPLRFKNFQIKPSECSGDISTFILPDIATCPECLAEVFDVTHRRYLYPFTNCTQCGPRFSIVESLPYDRSRTSMSCFKMCELCREEYENPKDRRFHAQPIACPDCGPHLEFWDAKGKILSEKNDALKMTVNALRDGKIVAVKGLGGFHLIVDAENNQAIARLRNRKHREEKPFALMYPFLEQIKMDCDVSQLEERLLCSPESPVVLLHRKQEVNNRALKNKISLNLVAPSNPFLGVMLPYTPLHHILMREIGHPVVATSGNHSGETICTQEDETLIRLANIADFFLVHNRPIIRHVDDSIVRVMLDRELVLRRARGYAPLPVTLKNSLQPCIAVGGHMKNTVALTNERNVFISQHIGDLDNLETCSAFEETLNSLTDIYGCKPARIACDFHPDYMSTRWAEKYNGECFYVQHHISHVLSCMAENELEGSLLGVAWDGSGYGLDGTVWGGEFFHVTNGSFHRVACWRPFPLPGGEMAVREPRRSALGLLFELLGEKVFNEPELTKAFSSQELSILQPMLNNGVNCPLTSSCGRLFDAVASIVRVREKCTFEGQAAMDLEFLTSEKNGKVCYPFELSKYLPGRKKFDSTSEGAVRRGQIRPPRRSVSQEDSDHNKVTGSEMCDLNLNYILNWAPMIFALIDDVFAEEDRGAMASKFHNTLIEAILSVAKKVGEERVLLTGGCFQNKYLTEKTVERLRLEGFRPYWHQRVPPNDGGLALGQIVAMNFFLKKGNSSHVFSGSR